MSTKEPTFEEGPFFLITATAYPHMLKHAVIWATDETTARNVFASRLNLPTTHCIISLVGDLDALRESLKVSNWSIIDLHREGYLRL